MAYKCSMNSLLETLEIKEKVELAFLVHIANIIPGVIHEHVLLNSINTILKKLGKHLHFLSRKFQGTLQLFRETLVE